MKKPLPLCACGCGQPVKARKSKTRRECYNLKGPEDAKARAKIRRDSPHSRALKVLREINYRGIKREKQKQWAKSNPHHAEKWRSENKERIKAKEAEYRKKHPEKGAAASRKQFQNLNYSVVAAFLGLPTAILRQHPYLYEMKRNVVIIRRKIKNEKQQKPNNNET